ncbi:MAG: carboxypeptidase regulatory-like domain-containing protein [Planctomycetaceae bacterium]|nr:carboxypeptidase regulatory-like domain-containing protein [Planctomycetaceae bacterium]
MILPAALLLLNGCSTAPSVGYDSIELVQVSGEVTLDGQPLPRAVVTFEAEDGQFSYGLTDDSGSYELQLDSDMEGVRPGKKVVRISTTRKILGLNADEGSVETPQDKAGLAGERVPPKFNSESALVADVTADQTTFDFDLQSN